MKENDNITAYFMLPFVYNVEKHTGFMPQVLCFNTNINYLDKNCKKTLMPGHNSFSSTRLV